ncbi:MAG: tetratricopeptide repeat protein [Ectothiorhodospiraceae bacterium]
MSLINDMLRDLERRDRGPAEAAGPPPAAPAGKRRGGRWLRRWLMACLILALVAALTYSGWTYWRTDRVLSGLLPESATQATESGSATEAPADDDSESVLEDDASGSSASVDPARVTGVTLDRDGDTVALQVTTTRPVLHQLEGAGEETTRLRLMVPAGADDASVPDLLAKVDATAGVDWRLGDEQLALDWRLSTPATVRADGHALSPGVTVTLTFDAAATSGGASETQQDAGTSSPNAASADRSDERNQEGGDEEAADTGDEPSGSSQAIPDPALAGESAVVPPPDEAETEPDAAPSIKQPSGDGAARETIARARAARDDGRLAEAAGLYREALEADPEAWRLRRELANVEQRRGDRQAAVAVLDAGLEQGVHTSALARAKARLLMADAPAEAVTVLEAHPPQGFGEGRWHALLASLYREQGRPEDAAALYREMVREQPRNGVWWLGLGVSLEEIGDTDRALAAYQRALRVGELDGELMAFLRRRVEKLE